MPTVWLNFQPAVELQHSFPCWMLPHPLPTLGTFLAVLTHAKPFLEWDVAPLGPLTGSSAFLKFQLLTNPLFARVFPDHCSNLMAWKHHYENPLEQRTRGTRKFLWSNPSVEKQCIAISRLPGASAQSLSWNTGSLCCSHIKMPLFVQLLSTQGCFYQLLISGHVSLSGQDWSLAVFSMFSLRCFCENE